MATLQAPPTEAASQATPSDSQEKPDMAPLSARGQRLAHKLARARTALEAAEPGDRDALLLGIALLRRDEALLDELTSRLDRRG